jgi:hypothetical protein
LIIDINRDGEGIVEDQFFNFRINVKNAGSNILTGLIPSGRYNGWRATLRLLPTNLAYTDPSRPFPVKMRYFIQQGNTILNLSSGNINNMQGYSTKFVGDRLILANFLEASGIQTEANVAFSAQNLARINNNIREQRMPRPLDIANRFLGNRIRQHRLLYRATINGWTANNFRQLSNNRGPTVTIATLQDGRFIGAYSPVSWGTVNQQYIDNPNAFLFDSERQYTSERGNGGPGRFTIYDLNKYGPTFGGGHDFLSLNSWWGNPRTLRQNIWTFMDNNNRGPLGLNRNTWAEHALRDLEVFSVSSAPAPPAPAPAPAPARAPGPPPLAPGQPLPAQPPGQRVAVPADAKGRVWGFGPRNSRTGCPVNIRGFRCRADGVWLEPVFDGEWVWHFDQETNRYYHRNAITATGTPAPRAPV